MCSRNRTSMKPAGARKINESSLRLRVKNRPAARPMIRSFFFAYLFAAMPAFGAPPSVDAAKQLHVPVVRVNVTDQAYDFVHPWAKKQPFSMHALAPVIANRRVLVTAEL